MTRRRSALHHAFLLLLIPIFTQFLDSALAQNGTSTSSSSSGCPSLSAVYVNAGASQVPCCGSATSPCGSLAEAVSRSALGATITLNPGTYTYASTTPINIGGKNLTIKGTDGSAPTSAAKPPERRLLLESATAATVLDCGGGACLSAACPKGAKQPCGSASLSGFSIANGVSNSSGGCVAVVGHQLSISDMRFSGCSAVVAGGAIAITGGSADISNIELTSCSAATDFNLLFSNAIPTAGGGGVSIDGASATMAGVRARNCTALFGTGGAIRVVRSPQFTLSGASGGVQQGAGSGSTTAISECWANTGGAVSFQESAAYVGDVNIEACQAVSGGGISDQASSLTVERTVLSRCVANYSNPAFLSDFTFFSSGGGFLLNASSSLTLTNVSVSQCTSTVDGGGAYITSAAMATLTGLSLDGNMAYQFAGGMYVVAVTQIFIMSSNFTANGISFESTYGKFSGGAMYAADSALFVVGCQFVANYGSPLLGGAGIHLTSMNNIASLTIDGSLFEANQGGEGLGVSFFGGFGYVTNSIFRNNVNANIGGAVLVQVETTFINCTFEGNSAYVQGGAIYYGAVGQLALTDCTFTNNSAGTSDGGALWMYPGFTNVTISRSKFIANSATASRGGAIFSGGSFLNIESSYFAQNTAAIKGGALAVAGAQSDGSVTLAAVATSNFVNNSSPLGGGAVYLGLNATAYLTTCRFARNNSTLGGAVVAQDFSTVVLENATCTGNSASSGGCIAMSDLAFAQMSGSTVRANRAKSEGGAVRASDSTTLDVSGSTVEANVAPSGGGLWVEMKAKLSLRNSSFPYNRAEFVGGVAYLTHYAAATISNCTFEGNRAPRGGALVADTMAVISLLSDSVFANNSASAVTLSGEVSANVSRTTFSRNAAATRNGGGMQVREQANVSVNRCVFLENFALNGGGASAEGTSTVTVTQSNFTANRAEYGAGLSLGGSSFFALTSSDWSGNNASVAGGGVAILQQSWGSLTSSDFDDNFAVLGGGGVYLNREVPRGAATTGGGSGASSPPLPNVTATNLTFDGNGAIYPQGTAFYESSYLPSVRATCVGCVAKTANDSIGSLPASFFFRWSGQWVVDPKYAAKRSNKGFVVRAAVQSPVENLKVVLVDAYGNQMVQDSSSVAAVQPTPLISGLLRGTANRGVVTLPPINTIVSVEDAQAPMNVKVAVSSPTAAFPDIYGEFTISFCANGTFYNATTYTCDECVVGSWCAAGQPMTPCPDGSFSFYPGAYDVDSQCVLCDDDNLDCTGGVLEVAQQAWLDPGSRNSTPTTYSCILTNGCNGYEYDSADTPQCLGGFDQSSRMCAQCDTTSFSFLGYCQNCTQTLKNIFPLLFILVLLLWFAFFLLADNYESFDIFLTEVQYLTVIASFNLNPPDNWVYRLIDVYSLSVFDVDVIGPNCVMYFGYFQAYVLALLVMLAGLLVFAIRYAIHMVAYLIRKHEQKARRLAMMTPAAVGAGPDGAEGGNECVMEGEEEEMTIEEVDDEMDHISFCNSILQGMFVWLDVCYMGILGRCLPVFVPQTVGDDTVMMFAPQILWWSNQHMALFIPSVILMVFYIAGLPAFYAYVLFSAKKAKTIFTPEFEDRFGFLTERFRRKFFWWQLVNIGIRVGFNVVLVFLMDLPNVQVTIIIAVQALRIAFEYKYAPFATSSVELLTALLNIGEIFFTLSLISFNYINEVQFSIVLMVISTIFMGVPAVFALLYEVVNKHIEGFNDGAMTEAWENEKVLKEDDFKNIDPYDIVDLSFISSWFRPHAIFAALLQEDVMELLLQVRHRFQVAYCAGLGEAEWVNRLKKPQQFGGLMQILQGNRTGHIVVARLRRHSVYCPDHAMWHADGVCPLGAALDMIESRPGTGHPSDGDMARVGLVSFAGEDGMNMRGDKEKTKKSLDVQPKVDFHRKKKEGGAGAGGGGGEVDKGKSKHKSSRSVGSAGGGNWPARLERKVSWRSAVVPSDDSTGEGETAQGRHLRTMSSMSGKTGPAFPRGDSTSSQRGMFARGDSMNSQRGAGMFHRGNSLSSQRGGGGGEGGGPEEFVEASLDMAELTIAFQRNFALLVRRERKGKVKSGEALRHVMHSHAVNVIIGWFTCPTSTAEDQKLFSKLLHAINKGLEEEAGGPSWLKGVLCFYHKRWSLSKRKAARVGEHAISHKKSFAKIAQEAVAEVSEGGEEEGEENVDGHPPDAPPALASASAATAAATPPLPPTGAKKLQRNDDSDED